jgi:hypothetical protein
LSSLGIGTPERMSEDVKDGASIFVEAYVHDCWCLPQLTSQPL